MMRSWLRRFFATHTISAERNSARKMRSLARVARRRPPMHLTIELLEERAVPAAIVVNNLVDSGVAGRLSLREAIDLASRTAGADVITFDAAAFGNFSTPATITTNAQIPWDIAIDPATQGALTIQGPGADKLSIQGNLSGVFRLLRGNVTISGLKITQGYADGFTQYGGGGIFVNATGAGNSLTLNDCTFTANEARRQPGNAAVYGGAIYVSQGIDQLTMKRCEISNNSSSNYGGGLAVSGNIPVTLTDCTIRDNRATKNNGGGIYCEGSLVVTNGILRDNAANGGGGGITSASVTLTNTTLSDNNAGLEGGGIQILGGSATLTKSTLSGNVATRGGAVINWGGTVSLSECTLSDNAGSSVGGAIYHGSGSLTLSASTLTGNSAGMGGAIASSGNGLTIADSTIHGNSADTSGGGVWLTASSASTTITRSTLYANRTSAGAAYGAGVDSRANLLMTNTIVAGSVGSDFAGNGLVAGSGNNLIGVDPRLAPLGKYGGDRLTMPPLPGSPAIDGGASGAITPAATKDGRGLTRVYGGIVDIGAVENQGYKTTLTGSSQSAPAYTRYATLSMKISALNANDPVEGGTVTFTAPLTGASAVLSATTVTIVNGIASTTATANGVPGAFSVLAKLNGTSVRILLTNLAGSTVVTNFGSPVAGKVNLAEALAWATSTSGNQTITFNATAVGATAKNLPDIIDLAKTGGATGSVDIKGPGSGLLTINGISLSSGTASISGLTVSNVSNSAALTITNATVSGGFGIKQRSGTLTVNNTTVRNNAGENGGGLEATGGTLLVTNSTFSGNFASNRGGGLYLQSVDATIINCTVTGNAARNAPPGQFDGYGFGGGGIFMLGSRVTIAQSTIVGNTAKHAGGVQWSTYDVSESPDGASFPSFPGTLRLANTVIAAQTVGSDLDYTEAYGSHGSTAPLETGSGNNLIGGNPLLGPLANNEGPTQTMVPLAGSPVIDAGDNTLVPAGLVTDQRAKQRIVGSTVDIGAVEAGGFTALSSPTIGYGTGSVKLTGHIEYTGQLPAGVDISITLNSVTQIARVDSAGNFSTTFSTGKLPVGSGSYPIRYVFAGNTSFPAVTEITKLTVNKRALTITASSASKPYGTEFDVATLTYTQSGLLPANDSIAGVTFTSTGAAASANAGVHATVPLVTGTGLENYAIKYVSGKLTVDKATLTITALNDSKNYGVTKSTNTTRYTAEGLVTANGDSISSVTSSSPGYTAKAAAGTYTITPTATAGNRLTNYNIVYVAGTLTVNQAALTITAKNDSKTYGATKTFTTTAFTQRGLVTGDTISGVTLTSAGAAADANAGTYSIVASDAAGTNLANYLITYVDGTLTVKKAALTITASSTSKTYGTTTSLGGTAFTAKGLLNGDTVSSVTLASTGTPSAASAGSYAITVSAAVGANLANYAITYVSGKLTVNKATLTITASNDSKTYGVLKSDSSTVYTATGLMNGDSITSVTSSSAGFAVSATVGTYLITPTSAAGIGLANYDIVYATGTLTVTKAPLTITARNDTKVRLTTKVFSSFAFTSTGLVTANGDTITGVTLTSTGAASSAPVGQYPILVRNALGNRLGNYAITYVSGTLTVFATK